MLAARYQRIQLVARDSLGCTAVDATQNSGTVGGVTNELDMASTQHRNMAAFELEIGGKLVQGQHRPTEHHVTHCTHSHTSYSLRRSLNFVIPASPLQIFPSLVHLNLHHLLIAHYGLRP